MRQRARQQLIRRRRASGQRTGRGDAGRTDQRVCDRHEFEAARARHIEIAEHLFDAGELQPCIRLVRIGVERRLQFRECLGELMAKLQNARARHAQFGRRSFLRVPPEPKRRFRVAERARIGVGLADFDVAPRSGQRQIEIDRRSAAIRAAAQGTHRQQRRRQAFEDDIVRGGSIRRGERRGPHQQRCRCDERRRAVRQVTGLPAHRRRPSGRRRPET